MFSSLNCKTKSEFRAAVAAGVPIMLWSPIMEMPAITGRARCQGPWPDSEARQRGGWHADVVVKDARIVEVH